MPEQNHGPSDSLSGLFMEYRNRLMDLAARKLNPVLLSRLSVEDVVQDAFVAACKRPEYFERHPEVPVYFKLRVILLQAIADCERKHLQCQKRDAFREVDIQAGPGSQGASQNAWDAFADSITSPLSRMARAERHELLRKTLESLSDNDRRILELRHFDGLSNQECAQALNIDPKAASIRHARALERLQVQLAAFTEFRP